MTDSARRSFAALTQASGVTDRWISAAVSFLMSDRAANITGTVTTMDAGNTA